MVGGRRISRRRFLQGAALAAGTAATARLEPGDASLTSAMVPPRPWAGSGPAPAGLGYPGLGDRAVLGAELQYFRMSPSAIPARLALCRQAHYGVIQSYVPWNVHEFVPGAFDFTGSSTPVLPDDHFDEYQIEDPLSETQDGGPIGRFGLTANTNLEAFLGEIAAGGFSAILRPGPFISDEWRNGGLPDWLLLEGWPTMFAYGPEGTPLSPGFPFSPPVGTVLGGSTLYYFPSPSYASSAYLEAARTWLGAFVTFLRKGKWFQSDGGPVVGLQVDDESCFFYRFGPFEVDYNPAMLQRWEAYSAGRRAPRLWPAPAAGVASLKTPFMWQRFKAEQNALYLGALAADLLGAGANVPINHELEQNMVPPADMVLDASQVILNGEFYEGSDPSALPLNEIVAQSVRAASRHEQPTFATEMSNGDALLFNILIGEGILGGLQFTYTEGVVDGTLDTLALVGRTFDAAGTMLSRSTRRADVAVVWDTSQAWAPFGSQRWGFQSDVRAVIESHVPALLTLLIRAGYAFDLLDVAVARPEDLARYPTVFLAASDICPAPFQQMLVDYVDHGGRLVCWPAPPTLDADLDPCTTLANALFPEAVAGWDPTDGLEVTVGPVTMPAWRGVTTYTLSAPSIAAALLGGVPCGYERPSGAGTAVLLGTWPAADAVAGRAGSIIEEQDVTGADAALVLAQLAAQHLGQEAAGMLPDTLPGGAPQLAEVWAYPNQRRGGETIASGLVAYFDGENVVGLVGINTDVNEPPLERYVYHPILQPHIDAVRLLAATTPAVTTNDTHLQARVLDGPEGGATVAVANRWPDARPVVLETTVGEMKIRLPRHGTFTLPGSTGILCPVGYPLMEGSTLVQATAQLLGVTASTSGFSVQFLAPAQAEAVFSFTSAPVELTVNGAPVATGSGSDVTLSLPAGQPIVAVTLA